MPHLGIRHSLIKILRFSTPIPWRGLIQRDILRDRIN